MLGLPLGIYMEGLADLLLTEHQFGRQSIGVTYALETFKDMKEKDEDRYLFDYGW